MPDSHDDHDRHPPHGERREPKLPPYAFSTGPTSPEGKAISSRNSLKHGCCSNQLILPDEDEHEWLALKQGWFDDYDPHTQASHALVYDAAVSHWLLLRARRRFYQAEWSISSEQPDPLQWTDRHHQTLDRFTRYRTTAERSFTRALNNLERLRKNRLQEADRLFRRDLLAMQIESRRAKEDAARLAKESQRVAKPAKSPEPAPEKFFNAQNSPKKHKKIVTLEQWVTVSVEDGQTVTHLYPSNERLIEHGKTLDPPPDLIYRRLEFLGPIPPEYAWTAAHPEEFEHGGAGVQRMTPETWLSVIQREAAAGSGHIGPTGVGNLPRPKERGGCECPTCSHNRAILETRTPGSEP